MKKILYAFCFILSLSAIAGLGYAHFVLIPKEVEKRILENFTNLGFETFWFEGIKHENGKVIISNITLDKDGFSSIERVDITFSLWRFLLSPDSAQNVTITGLNLTGIISDGFNAQLSGLPDYQSFIAQIPKTPARMITIDQSTVNLLSDTFGGVKLDYTGQINLRDPSNIILNGTLSSRQHKLTFHSKVKGNLDEQHNINLIAETEQISVLTDDISLKRGSASINFQYDVKNETLSTNAEFHISKLNWRTLPLNKLKGSYTVANNTSKLSVEGQTSGVNAITWSADVGQQEDEAKKASISLTPDNITDVIDYLKYNSIINKDEHFPSSFKMISKPIIKIEAAIADDKTFKGKFQAFLNNPDLVVNGLFNQDDQKITKGSFYVSKTNVYPNDDQNEKEQASYLEISSAGSFEYATQQEKNDLSWSIKTQVHNGQIDFGVFKIPNITGIFTHNPKSKQANLTLPFRLNLKDIIEQKGFIDLNTEDKASSILGAARLSVYGGIIETQAPIIKKSGAIQDSFSLRVSDINISQLFTDAGFNDVTVYGYMGGLIPMKIGSKEVDVNGGILQSQGGGVVSMSEKMALALFPGESKKMHNIRAALKNYHYEFFEIRLDGDLSGRIMMTLNASGQNPDFKSTKPIDLNLQIETQISMLFSSLLKD